MEVLLKVRVHPIQYLLIGAALCLFYLLHLSLAEHLGFALAYLIASITIAALNGVYSFWVLGTAKRAALISTLLSGLYAYLYAVLQQQDFALLSGSLALLVALATVMFFTRKVRWYGNSNGGGAQHLPS